MLSRKECPVERKELKKRGGGDRSDRSQIRNNVTDRCCHGALSWVSRVPVMPPGFLPCQGLDRCIGVAKEVARATVDAWFCLLSRGIFFFRLNTLCVQFHFCPHLGVGGILPM